MPTAVIVDMIRTPLGRRNGRLKDWHPVDLAAAILELDLDGGLVPGADESQHRSVSQALSERVRHLVADSERGWLA